MPGLRTGLRARPSCSASRLESSESSLAASRAEARGAGQRADGFQLLWFVFWREREGVEVEFFFYAIKTGKEFET